jgi:hypothetical protein
MMKLDKNSSQWFVRFLAAEVSSFSRAFDKKDPYCSKTIIKYSTAAHKLKKKLTCN